MIHKAIEVNLNRPNVLTGPAANLPHVLERHQAMASSPSAVSTRPFRKEDLVYQVVTVVAMVTLVASVWLF